MKWRAIILIMRKLSKVSYWLFVISGGSGPSAQMQGCLIKNAPTFVQMAHYHH
jgi:hypothetical protein